MNLLLDVPNPFTDVVVSDPWAFDAARTPDVTEVHDSAFAKCIGLVQRDQRHQKQASLLVHGPAGSGKTHLIARLLRRLTQPESAAIPCWVSCEPGNRNSLWSWLRRSLVNDLMRPYKKGVTQLERLLQHRVPNLFAGASHDSSLLAQLANLFSRPGGLASVQKRLKTELYPRVLLNASLRSVLPAYFSEAKDDAIDWLRGEVLSEEKLKHLGVSTAALSDAAREEQSRDVVLSLCRLSDERLQMVFLFDQIEGLQSTLRDDESFLKFGQVLAKLRTEAAAALLLVSFIRTDYREQLKNAVGQAHWARLAENETALSPLKWESGAQIIMRRMNAVDGLRALRQGQNDPFWPLGRQRLSAIFEKHRYGCTPRELLSACTAAFDGLSGDEAIKPAMHDFLLAKWEQRRQQSRGVADAERLQRVVNGLPWLVQLLGASLRRVESDDLNAQLPDVALVLEGPDGARTAFSPCAKTPHVWQRFRRLHDRWKAHLAQKNGCRRLVVLCDADSKGFTGATKERLAQLRVLSRVEWVYFPPDPLLGLDALTMLLAEAHNGNLTRDGETVEGKDVDVWARDGLTQPLHPLGMLREFFDDLNLRSPTTADARREAVDAAPTRR